MSESRLEMDQLATAGWRRWRNSWVAGFAFCSRGGLDRHARAQTAEVRPGERHVRFVLKD